MIYKYIRHEGDKVVVEIVTAHEFLKEVIMHIQENHFKMFIIYDKRGVRMSKFGERLN